MSVEALFSGMKISATGMTAQRYRMDIIANNLANASTTRSEEGGPYKRQDLALVSLTDPATGQGAGVAVQKVLTDESSPRMVYDPGHPDADTKGFVAYPNVSVMREMTGMIQALRAYEANVTAFGAAKEMLNKSFEIAAV